MVTDRWTRQACLALFLVVAGSRLAMVSWVGAQLPHWDQWFAEFGSVVAPLAQGRFHVRDLASPRNEHWLLYPRLMTLGMTLASGRWEPLDEAIVSAVVRALGLVCFFLLLGRNQEIRARSALLVLLGLLGALPLGVFNLLSGYQVQFFIGEILALGSLAFLCGGALTVDRLAGGAVCLLLGLLNMASAPITAAAAAMVLALRGATATGPARRTNLSAAIFLIVFAGVVFWTTPRAVSTMLGARSVAEFGSTLLRLWAWPFPEAPILGLLSLVPAAALVTRVLSDRVQRDTAWFILALVFSALIQDAAIAYARAQSGVSFPQYRDGLWLRGVLGFIALAEARRPRDARGLPSRALSLGAPVWAFGLVALMLIDAGLRGLPEIRATRAGVAERQPRVSRALDAGDFGDFEREIDGILAKGNLSFFDDPSGRFAIPPRVIADLKENGSVVLPKLPAALAGGGSSSLSTALRGLASLGPALAGGGLLLALLCVRFALREGTVGGTP